MGRPPGRGAVAGPAVRHGCLGRTPSAGAVEALGRGVLAVAGGVLHQLDLLRHGAAGARFRLGADAHLPRHPAAIRAGLSRRAEAVPPRARTQQHLARRLHRHAARPQFGAGRDRHRDRGDRHGSLPLLATEGRGHEPWPGHARQRPRAAGLAGQRAVRGDRARGLRHAVRHASRLGDRAQPRPRASDGGGVAAEAGGDARPRTVAADATRRLGRHAAAPRRGRHRRLSGLGAAGRTGDADAAAPVPCRHRRGARRGPSAHRALALPALPRADRAAGAATGDGGRGDTRRHGRARRPLRARPAPGRRRAGHGPAGLSRRAVGGDRHADPRDAHAERDDRQPLAHAAEVARRLARRRRRPARRGAAPAPLRHRRRAGFGLGLQPRARRQRGTRGSRRPVVLGPGHAGAGRRIRAVAAADAALGGDCRSRGGLPHLGLGAAARRGRADGLHAHRPPQCALRMGVAVAAGPVRSGGLEPAEPRRGRQLARRHRAAAVAGQLAKFERRPSRRPARCRGGEAAGLALPRRRPPRRRASRCARHRAAARGAVGPRGARARRRRWRLLRAPAARCAAPAQRPRAGAGGGARRRGHARPALQPAAAGSGARAHEPRHQRRRPRPASGGV